MIGHQTWVFKRTEPNLWTVGHHDTDGRFEPESDHPTPEAAAARVHYLNGGSPAIKQPSDPEPVVIFDEVGQPIVTVHRDHTVTLHQPDKTNDAARLFWQSVQQFGVAHCVREDHHA